MPRTRIERIASQETGITADTALRLAKALGTTAELWLNLQTGYDVQAARQDLGKILDRLETVNKPKAAWCFDPNKGDSRSSENCCTNKILVHWTVNQSVH